MREITIEILKLIIMIATALITRYAIPWLKARTENAVMQSVIDWTFQAVHAAEQAHQALPGPDRKAIVTKFIKEVLQQKNISLTDEEIDMLIESAVGQMNKGIA